MRAKTERATHVTPRYRHRMKQRTIELMQRLVGAWHGRGSGSYPDVPPFRYAEETTIALARDWQMLHVLQQTWQIDDAGARQRALHLEAGIIVARDDGAMVYSCGQDSGRVEAMVAMPALDDGGVLRLAWQTIAHGNDARLVKLGRDWRVGSDRFEYEAYLSTVRTPEYRRHLEAQLHRR